MRLRRLETLIACLCMLGAPITSPVYALEWRSPDPFRTEQNTSPAPNVPWLPSGNLPEVQAPVVELPDSIRAGEPLSLAELTDLALRTNPVTRRAWLAARAAAFGVAIEQADRLPQLSGVLSATRSLGVSAAGGVVPWQSRAVPSITLTHVLYDFGLREARIDAAAFRLLAANLTQNRVLQDVTFQVEQAYYRLIGLEALIRANELSIKNAQTALDAARRRRESGLATIGDEARAETLVAQAQLNLTRSRGDFEKTRGQLAAAAGIPVNAIVRVRAMEMPLQVSDLTDSVDMMLGRAKALRPDLAAAEAQVRAARSAAEATRKAGMPTIELSATAGRTFFSDGRSSLESYNVGLNVRIPLFTGFRNTYSIRQAEAVAAQAEATRDGLVRQAELDVWQAYYDLNTASSGIKNTEAQVRAAELTAESTLARFEAGFGSVLDLITAQVEESNARVQRIQSYLDWYTALARLNFAVGQSDSSSYVR